MTYTREMASLVARHQLDKFGYGNISELIIDPNLASLWFDALAYYKQNNHYLSLDDITDPQPGVTYFIRLENSRLEYQWNGKWNDEPLVLPDSIYR